MRSPSETVKEIFWKSGAVPYRFESPCALIIGGKLFGLLLESVYPRRVREAKRGGVKAAVIYEIFRLCDAPAGVSRVLEPIAAVGEPPAGISDGNCRGQRPPERKRHVGNQAEYAEGDPKDFPLHIAILDASGPVMSHRRGQMFQVELLAGTAIPMISKRMRNDS